MKIVTFIRKNDYTPKRVVDFPRERDTFRNKIMEIVEDFDEKSYNNNGKPWKSSRILRVNPNFFIFLHFLHFSSFFFHEVFHFSLFCNGFNPSTPPVGERRLPSAVADFMITKEKKIQILLYVETLPTIQ